MTNNVLPPFYFCVVKWVGYDIQGHYKVLDKYNYVTYYILEFLQSTKYV